MTAPAPVVRGDLIAAVKQAVVEAAVVGNAVYREQADLTRITAPYAILADTEPADALTGDGRPIAQTRVVTVTLLQTNNAQANPRLGHKLSEALHGRRVTVGVESDPTTWRTLFLRCLGRVDHTFSEGYDEQQVSVSCYGPACP